jgi:ABC-2 type transport system permease protein
MIYLIYKDLLLFLKDKKSIVISLLLPILLTSFFSFLFGAVKLKSTDKQIRLSIVVEENSPSIDSILKLLADSPSFIITEFSAEGASNVFKERKSDAILTFAKGFTVDLTSPLNKYFTVIYDHSEHAKSAFILYQLNRTIAPFIMARRNSEVLENSLNNMLEGMGESDKAIMKADIKAQFIQSSPTDNAFNPIGISILPPNITINTPELIQAVSGTAIMLLLFSVINLGSTLLSEISHGSFKRVLLSPTPSSFIIISKLVTGVIVSCAQLLILFLFSVLVLGLNLRGNGLELLLLIGISALACSGFGVFFAVICESKKQLDSLSTLFILLMSALGGSMVPLFLLPESVQTFSHFSINYWFISGCYDLFWRDYSLSSFLISVVVLLSIGSILTFLSVFIFNRKLRSGKYF